MFGVCGYLYLETDVFKSDKELFFKYLQKSDIVDSKLKNYMQKIQENPYKSDKTITSSSDDTTLSKILSNMKLSLSSKVDVQNDVQERNLSILYNNENIFPISIRRVGDMIGFQSDHVGGKYIGLDMSKELPGSEEGLLELQGNIDTYLTAANGISYPEDIETHIYEIYGTILNTTLPKEKFSSQEVDEKVGYTLTLTDTEILAVTKALLTELQTDDVITGYLNSTFGITIELEEIEMYIDEINTKIANASSKTPITTTITIWVENDQVSLIESNSEDLILKLEKSSTNDNLTYYISMNNLKEGTKTNLELKYTGMNSLIQVTESHKAEINTLEESYTIKMESNVSFVDSIDVEEINHETTLILNNNRTIEDNDNIWNAVVERFELVYEEQSGKIISSFAGLEFESGANNQLTIQENNDQYSIYEGKEVRGSIVKGLFTVVEKNISENTCSIEKIYINNTPYQVTTNIENIKNMIDTNKNYDIITSQDSYGYINEIVLSESKDGE